MQNVSNIRGIRAVRAETDPAALVNSIRAAVEASRATMDQRIVALADRLTEIEQSATGGSLAFGGGHQRKTLAAIIAATPEFAALRDKRTKQAGFQVQSADLLSVQANTITNDGDTLAPYDRKAGIIASPQRRAWLRERMLIIPCGAGGVEFTRENAFTNNAATQAGGSPIEYEGVTKAESAITFELVNARVPTVAHWIKMSRQAMDDQPALSGFLNMRLRYGLDLELERQIISGDGTGGDMSGLAEAATAFTPTSGDTELDSLSRAKATLETANFMPDCIVLHPNDYGAMERIKTTTGEYIIGQPAGALQPVLWGVPVFRSATVSAGKFLMADLAGSCALFMRQDAVVDMTESNDTDFVKNLITVRAELRAVLGVFVPAGVLYGDLTL